MHAGQVAVKVGRDAHVSARCRSPSAATWSGWSRRRVRRPGRGDRAVRPLLRRRRAAPGAPAVRRPQRPAHQEQRGLPRGAAGPGRALGLGRRRADPQGRRGHQHLRVQPQPGAHRRLPGRLGAQPGDRDRRDRRRRARLDHRPVRRRAAVLPAQPGHHRGRGPPAGGARLLCRHHPPGRRAGDRAAAARRRRGRARGITRGSCAADELRPGLRGRRRRSRVRVSPVEVDGIEIAIVHSGGDVLRDRRRVLARRRSRCRRAMSATARSSATCTGPASTWRTGEPLGLPATEPVRSTPARFPATTSWSTSPPL